VVSVPAGAQAAGDSRPGRSAQGQPAARTLGHIVKVRLASLRAGQKVGFFISKARSQDLLVLRELLEAGTLTPVVELSYPLAEAAEALRHLGAGHARGKLPMVVGGPASEHRVDPAG
jgi:NADPH:quinone reductase-like Zn-dependent oxidoreductase